MKPKHNSVNKFLLQNHGQAQTASTMQCRICYLSHCATTWMITKNISKTLQSTFVRDLKTYWFLSSHFNLIFIVFNITQTHGTQVAKHPSPLRFLDTKGTTILPCLWRLGDVSLSKMKSSIASIYMNFSTKWSMTKFSQTHHASKPGLGKNTSSRTSPVWD